MESYFEMLHNHKKGKTNFLVENQMNSKEIRMIENNLTNEIGKIKQSHSKKEERSSNEFY